MDLILVLHMSQKGSGDRHCEINGDVADACEKNEGQAVRDE